MGGDVVAAVKEFFYNDKELNNKILFSIPKTLEAEYRPISWCSVVYKTISKIIANRDKLILKICISRN